MHLPKQRCRGAAAGVQAEALLRLLALRQAGGGGRREADPRLCGAGQLGGVTP